MKKSKATKKVPNPKYSVNKPEGKPLVNELETFFKPTKADKKLPRNKEK